MRAHSREQQSIMHYLLGEAEAEESSRFEERLITDKGFYEELTIAEDELIDQYLDGELTTLEREQFEKQFLLSPERRQKVRFARALHRTANADEYQAVETIDSQARSVSTPAWMSHFPLNLLRSNAVLSYAVLGLLLFGGIGLWVIWSNQQGHVRVPGRTATITLLPGATRADQSSTNTVSNSADIETIQLRLALADPKESYRVKVVNDEDKQVWSGDGVSQTDAGQGSIVANVPAQALPNGDYRVLLSRRLVNGSFEEVLGYTFHVVP